MPTRARVAGRLVMVLLWAAVPAGSVLAQAPEVHYYHQGVMPPGAIGSLQLQRGGPLPGYFQPVEIKAPQGVLISLAESGTFVPPDPAPVTVGLLVGQVYRLRVMNIPRHEGLEVFPTVEVIDRLYPPADQVWRFPIEVVLTGEDLELALEGKFVTRVIYLEDPRMALPVAQDPEAQEWFDVAPGRDPLAAADQLGRPVAILRMGARLPSGYPGANASFLFGSPPVLRPAPPVPGPAPPVEAPSANPARLGPARSPRASS